MIDKAQIESLEEEVRVKSEEAIQCDTYVNMTTQAETCANGETYANLDTYANAETYAKLAFSEDEIVETPGTDDVELFDDAFTME